MIRRLGSTLAVLLLGGAAGVVASTAPAAAAACPAGTGVTVVVGSSVSCDADGGGTATASFRDAGHTLTPVDRQPGFVCKVDGMPSGISCVNTPPADAYWGLFWSDGTSGTWVYSSQGVGSLKVPAGGWVAFVFQDSSSRTYPSVRPVTRAAPAPTSAPAPAAPTAGSTPRARPSTSPRATTEPRATATAPAGGAAPAPTPTVVGATPTPTPTRTASTPTPAASPDRRTSGPGPTAAPGTGEELVTAADDDGSDGQGGPVALGWVAGGLVVALLAGMAAALQRRRSAGGPS